MPCCLPRARGVDVSVVIVNWNSREYLRKCLASLYGETAGLALEVVAAAGERSMGLDLRDHDQVAAVHDELCAFRGVDQLYVTDGSFMPTSAALNPSLTIAANALHAATSFAS